MSEIHFFNANALARKLSRGEVSEVLALKHIIIYWIIYGFSFEIPITASFMEEYPPNFTSIVGLLFPILIAFVIYYGFWFVYQANQKGDGKQFFLRISALSLPIALQLMVVFLLVGTVLGFLAAAASSADSAFGAGIVTTLFIVAAFIFQCAFFVRMGSCISVAASTDD